MNFRVIANLIGRILCAESAFLLPAAGVSLYYSEAGAMRAILLAAICTAVAGGLLLLPKPGQKSFYAREGFVSVALAWIALSFFGALPFYFSGEIPRFVDCIFETVSGFTTTGASILPKVEVLSKGLLYWRSFTHWLGGMGILVFVLAVDPMSHGSGQSVYLLRAESPGPEVEKLVPQMHQSAKILYGMYIGLTLLEIVLLLMGGMPFFDTITIAFGTAGTGGFAVRSDSVGSYSAYLQGVVTVFMALFGVNFSIYYLLLKRKFSQVLRNEELRLYLVIMVGTSLIIAMNTSGYYTGFGQALHHAAFQVSSIMTTTGFSTVDFNLWPEFSKTLLLLLMIVGASAGSTGGGVKVSRLLLIYKSMRLGLRGILSPRSVRALQMDGKVVSENTMRGITVYMASYFAVAAGSVLIVSWNNFGLETTVSAVLACLNNIGPGLGLVGPMSCYEAFGDLTKWVLCADMLVGRLEILPFLMLLMPAVWKKT